MLSLILENLPQAIVIVGFDNRIKATNQKMVECFGLAPAFVNSGINITETLCELAHSSGQESSIFEKTITNTRLMQPFTQEFQQKVKEQYRWYQLHHNPLPDGDYVLTFTDITQLKETERKLRESTLILKQTLASLNEAIFVIETVTSTIVDCNLTAERMFGYEFDEIIGAKTSCLHVSEKTSLQFGVDMLRAFETKGFYETQMKMKRSNGTIFDSEHTVTPIHDEKSGAIVRHVSVVRDISERLKTETSEKESRERYRAIVNAFDGFIYICAQDYTVTYMNENLIKRTGRNAVGEQCYKALHDLDAVCHWCVNDRVKNGEIVKWEVQSPKDGRWLYVVNSPIFNMDGSVSKQSMIIDITDRKQMELALSESEQKFRTFWEKSPIAIWEEDFSAVKARFEYLSGLGVTDIRAYLDDHPDEVKLLSSLVKILNVNQKSLDLLGVASKEELILELPRYFNETSLDIFKDEMATLAEGKTSYECEIPIINNVGEVLHLSLSLVVLPSHKQDLDHVLVSFIDMTERKKMAQHLQQSEREFRWIFEQALVGIAVVTPDLHIAKVNKKFSEMLGYFENELEKKTVEEITYSDDREMSRINALKALSTELPGINYEKRFITRDGTPLWAEVHIALMRDEFGNPVSFMGLIQDISARKQAEHSMREYQKQLNALANELSLAEERERRKLASGLHDQVIQNLAMGKIILSEKLGEETSDECRAMNEKLWGIFDAIIRDSRRLIFDISPPLLYDLGLGAAVDELGSRMGEEHGFCFELVESGNGCVMEEALTVALYQMIRELLINIIKHAHADDVRLSIISSADAVDITVSDNGIGIEPNKIPGLFHTRDEFGLFSIQQRITSLGGTITVETSNTTGTSIILKAPIHKIECKSHHIGSD